MKGITIVDCLEDGMRGELRDEIERRDEEGISGKRRHMSVLSCLEDGGRMTS